MKPITQQEITDYVEANIQNFHQRRLANLQKLKLMDIIRRKTLTQHKIFKDHPRRFSVLTR